MANTIFINGRSCYLKDRNGNLLIPKTNSSLVVFEDGQNLDQKIANLVDFSDLSHINEQFESINLQLKRLNYDIGTTNNYYKLKELNGESGLLIDELNSIKNSITGFNTIVNSVESLNKINQQLQSDVSNLQASFNTHNQNSEFRINTLEHQVTELSKRIDEFPNGEIINIEKITITDETGLLVNSLLASTDIYESMCNNIEGFINKQVSQSVINAYVTLYKLEIKRLSDMPSHIQSLVSIELMK